MVMSSLEQLEQLALRQQLELQREERKFLNRLGNLTLLRSHCSKLTNQRDKVEQLQTMHDRLLEQEFTLRKLRRMRTEVDSQRQKNDKLARELAKVKQDLEEKESKLASLKAPPKKSGAIIEKSAKAVDEIGISNNQTQNGTRKPVTELTINGKEVSPASGSPQIVAKKLIMPEKRVDAVDSVRNDRKTIVSVQHNDDDDDEEIATSFITGWTPKSSTVDGNSNRYSASDAEFFSGGDSNHLMISGADGQIIAAENVRPASDVIPHAATLPTYRYVPRGQTFLRRIGVDGGRAKTVESLYKDFHPRALQQTAAVSILDSSAESSAGNTNSQPAAPPPEQPQISSSVRIKVEESDSQVTIVKQMVLKSILSSNKDSSKKTSARRVRFSPIALLLDAALDGDLELVKSLLNQVEDPSAPNDEGITALHNAICAGHSQMVELLVSKGCDVNSSDCDGWTGLHCASSCNNKELCQLLVENGAAPLALTSPDRETPRDKCEPDEDFFAECYAYLLECEEQLGRANDGIVYAAFDFDPKNDLDNNSEFSNDMLSFKMGAKLKVLRRGDDDESDWWWAKVVAAPQRGQKNDDRSEVGREGYLPNSHISLFPRNDAFCQRYAKLLLS